MASQAATVPKNTKPCSRTTRVCEPTARRYCVCSGCRRTVDRAIEPLSTDRIARRRDDVTTKLPQARMTAVISVLDGHGNALPTKMPCRVSRIYAELDAPQ